VPEPLKEAGWVQTAVVQVVGIPLADSGMDPMGDRMVVVLGVDSTKGVAAALVQRN